MFKKIIGIALIISAFVVEAMWLGACFGTVIVGIVLLILAPGILFAPFNILFTMGIAFLAYEPIQGFDNHSYGNGDFYENSSRYYREDEEEGISGRQSYGMQKYYEILGCNPDDDFETVKKAYRRLSKEFHPDSLESKGLDGAFTEFAKKKMQEINEAYLAIKKTKVSHAA